MDPNWNAAQQSLEFRKAINKLMGKRIYTAYTPSIHGINMVKAMINIQEHTNWVLNLVKAKYSLKDKSEAIDRLAKEYEENLLEPEFKPEFVEEILKREKEGKFKRVKSIDDLFR